jgi:hypothetical protein
MMRKILLVVWMASLAALLSLLGYMWLHETTVHRTILSLAEDVGMIWGGSFLAWAVLTWKAKQ